jgi:hypothetical protein
VSGRIELVFGTSTIPSDPVAGILELLGGLAGEERAGWPAIAQSERVAGLAQVVERAQAELVRATATWDGAVAYADDGALSPIAWLLHHTRMSEARADRLVRCARLVRRHDRTAKVLAAGDVTSGHVEVLADKTRRHAGIYAEHEDVLLDAAGALGVDDFKLAAEKWRLLADEDRAKREKTGAVEHATFHLSPTFAGRYAFGGDLDSEGAKTVLDALDARCRPEPGGQPGESTPRTLAERRAEALVEMAAASLVAGSPGGHPTVTADVVVDIDTLSGHPPADLTKIRCELSTGDPVTRETALRLCCDAGIGRVVMNGASEILDLGHRTRVVSPAQRRALAHRDRGCVFPGCHRKVEWTDAHHLQHWVDGGPTDLDNLCLLCRRHHVMVHEGGWRLARDPVGGGWTAEPSPPWYGP